MMPAAIQHLNPDGMHKNPAYTQAVVVSGAAKTVYIGGQNAVDENGEIVGKGDLAAQTAQIFKNIETCLGAAGAKLEHIIKWNVYIVQGQDIRQGFGVFQQVWGDRPNPPVITGVMVAGLAHPDFLAEMDAVAVVPDGG